MFIICYELEPGKYQENFKKYEISQYKILGEYDTSKSYSYNLKLSR